MTARWRKTLGAWLLLLASLIHASQAHAQQEPQPLRVSTFVIAPFVMQSHGQLTGFSIDLWNEIAARLHIQTHYDVAPDVNALFQTLRDGDDDVAVSGLFYSVERDREFDFSYPIMESGLRVMVRDTGETASVLPLRRFGELLISRTTLLWFAMAALLTLIAAHVVWFVDYLQGYKSGKSTRYFPGIFRAIYWAASTLFTQEDEPRRRALSRAIALVWMFVGIVFVASYTAQLTSKLTVEHIRGSINGPDDLAGLTVATVASGSALPWLRNRDVQVREYASDHAAFDALLKGDVDAVVLGSAGLGYFAAHEGKGRVKLVGPSFNENDVGFVFPLNSALLKRVNGALLAMREDGTYQRIYDRWFGTR
ncbi:transporter substrate-binding domain-containing protein [Paraburkholderia adhaesiva]|uniref:transporter substrate-binding domain-containing protein n=1 Tax=Paraburkholderia adhaesiva TaxID=2883244 RepID=UPI001F189259|nr:transporter substrate-binding domain-containing protein [Paraburkholderia adhaesiva]